MSFLLRGMLPCDIAMSQGHARQNGVYKYFYRVASLISM